MGREPLRPVDDVELDVDSRALVLELCEDASVSYWYLVVASDMMTIESDSDVVGAAFRRLLECCEAMSY